ncbi:DUF1294 domain-containing protein [Cohnella silvisoli]|uniref:DUF1294 domain-containing protein n=1 Tax=Cohnella silvisoli TaxID=2873699 RepID=A0ABV1L036_9BACL|nr:DUF1294 domain-containing protein [Cohnella silvisoli]MCD9024883.1 DUF1294 domain-containing protein [Cohnella silvisoli]
MNAQYWIAIGIVVNLITLSLMAYDKSQARKHGRRVPERTLFLWAAIGGAAGAIVAMRIWRHKTKHPSFVFGMPALLLLHVVLLYLFLQD